MIKLQTKQVFIILFILSRVPVKFIIAYSIGLKRIRTYNLRKAHCVGFRIHRKIILNVM